MDQATISIVQSTFKQVVPIADKAAELFYGKLFQLDPSLKPLFKGDLIEQGKKLMQMIGAAVKGLNNLDTLVPVVEDLGRRHVNYGVKDEHYSTVGTALIWTLEQGLADAFTEEIKEAWIETYALLSSTMRSAAKTATTA